MKATQTCRATVLFATALFTIALAENDSKQLLPPVPVVIEDADADFFLAPRGHSESPHVGLRGGLLRRTEDSFETSRLLEEISAAGPEPSWASKYRWATLVLDFLYVFLMAAQKTVTGSYPSGRFAGRLRKITIVHALCGAFIIYFGCYLQISNVISTVTLQDDQEVHRRIGYYIFGGVTVLHSITVLAVLPKVMGEKRITIPAYFGAGVVNAVNAITLLYNPSLQNAFLVWGSVNTFVYVRAILLVLTPAHIDWELMYTCGIVMASLVTYPLSLQGIWVYFVVPLALVYAPFHEKFVHWFGAFGFTEEDTESGNLPAKKNIASTTLLLRSTLIDKGYADKLEKDPRAQSAASKLQVLIRSKSAKSRRSLNSDSHLGEIPEDSSATPCDKEDLDLLTTGQVPAGSARPSLMRSAPGSNASVSTRLLQGSSRLFQRSTRKITQTALDIEAIAGDLARHL